MDLQMKPVLELQAALWSGKMTSRELTEQALARINDPDGEGSRAFLQVHDEVLVEVPEDECDAVGPLVIELMRGAASLDVPLEVNVAWGDTWAAAKS